MKIDTSQLCFGLNENLDQESLAIILQLIGRKEFSDLLASRMNSEEIEKFMNQITGLLKQHLTEAEYHSKFLLNEKHHH